MGGKKIGACEGQVVATPAPLSGERLPGGSGGKASVGYAGIVKMGLREGREVLGGVNGSTKSSPDRIAECGASVKFNGITGTNHDVGISGASRDEDCCSSERPIEEALYELTLQCGEIAESAELESMRPSPESLAVSSGSKAPVDCNGGETAEDGADLGGSNDMSDDHWEPPRMDYLADDASSEQPVQHVREYDLHRSASDNRDFRPPALILPDAPNLDSDFAGQSSESTYRLPQSYLPSSLVTSPHDTKQNLLDPNAREYVYTPTTSPSPCPSPALSSHKAIVQPPPYHMEQPPHISYAPAMELGPVMYSTDYTGGPVMPLYGSGGPLFGPIPGSPTPPWENQPMGMGMHGGELSHHMPGGSGALAPPPLAGQHHHLLRPYVSAPLMHSYIPSGCSPPIGSPTGSVPAFAVPPSLTGREHVSRALLLSGVPTELTDFSLKQELEQWGLVRALCLERRHEGLVTTHYFDLRHSKEALRDIQQQHLVQQQRMVQMIQQQRQRSGGHGAQIESDLEKQDFFKDSSRDDESVPPARGLIGGKAVWAQYTVPVGPVVGGDGHNQGTLVVFNLDVDMPHDELRAAFEAHGAVKELRETPAKRQHKFVEFYDVRDAARALAALDGHEIGGKRVKIEFSRPGGQARRARAQAAQAQVLAHQGGPLVPMVGNRLNAPLPGAMQGQPWYLWGGADPSMVPSQSMAGPPGPPQYLWANYQHVTPVPLIAPLGTLVQQQQQQWNIGHAQLQHLPYQNQPMPSGPAAPAMGMPGLVLSAGSSEGGGSHGRQFGRGGGGCFSGAPCSPGSSFHGGFGRGSASSSRGSDEPAGRRRRGGGVNTASSSAGGSLSKMDLTCLPSSLSDTSKQHGSEGGGSGPRDSPRGGKSGLTPKSSPREHAQYLFNPDLPELNSESPRTTLMIKNIPNKYSQSMLLTLLDQHCLCCNNNIVDPNEPQSGYDFVYLPIDFKNRCNLGYAFVNFTTVQGTLRLYKSFHAQQWEAFNSRKVCQVTYARVQGRAALEEHFRNSRFACDTDDYLPLVFSPPRTGICLPPPIVAAGHLAGRALICSPRGEIQSCRTNRSGDLQEKISEQTLGSDHDDSESSVGSSGATDIGGSGQTGRRPHR